MCVRVGLCERWVSFIVSLFSWSIPERDMFCENITTFFQIDIPLSGAILGTAVWDE